MCNNSFTCEFWYPIDCDKVRCINEPTAITKIRIFIDMALDFACSALCSLEILHTTPSNGWNSSAPSPMVYFHNFTNVRRFSVAVSLATFIAMSEFRSFHFGTKNLFDRVA